VIAFTILGLVVFWLWCFQFGYWLGYGAQVLEALLRIEVISYRFRHDMRAFTAALEARA
jgi:hypothetical protein